MKCLYINIFIFNFPPVPPLFLKSCRSHLQQSHLQLHAAHTSFTNSPHAARTNKRKRESDRTGHDHQGHYHLHKSVCWRRAFYISHSDPKLKTQTNTNFTYTKDYYLIFVILYVKKMNGWQTSFCSCCSCSCHCSLFFLFMRNLLFSAFSNELLIRGENEICSNLWIHII